MRTAPEVRSRIRGLAPLAAAALLLGLGLAGSAARGAASGAAASWSRPAADVAVFAYDARAPLGVEVTASRKPPGLTVLSLSYASPKGGRVPALLMVPDGKGPFAGMLFLHGAPGDHRAMIPEAGILARRGVVALLIDAPFSRGDRAGEPLALDERSRDDQVQLIVDLRRGVDLLVSRPDVDPRRLGFLGVSYGGAMGGLLAGVERRLAAYALVVGDGGLVSHVSGDASPLRELPPEEAARWLRAMEPIEPIRFVGRAAPAHLLFQNGRRDSLVPPAHGEAYQRAGSEPKTTLWYDAGHALGEKAERDRHEWLAERLGIAHPDATADVPAASR